MGSTRENNSKRTRQMATDLHFQCGLEDYVFDWPAGIDGQPAVAQVERSSVSEAIMRNLQIELIQLEVKYCENCGGLWCRRTGDKGIYCPTCRRRDFSGDRQTFKGVTTQ